MGTKAVVLAGKNYREFLMPTFRLLFGDVVVPMQGMMGEQLSWLSAGTKPACVEELMTKKRMVKLEKSEQASLIRSGSIEITCGNCNTKMLPDSDDLVSCPKCGKGVGEWDKVEVKETFVPGRKN